MLLRSSSSPLPNSWLPSSSPFSKDPHHDRVPPVEVVVISMAPSTRRPVMVRALSESDITDVSAPAVSKRRPLTASHKGPEADQDSSRCIANEIPPPSSLPPLFLSSSDLVDGTSFASFKAGHLDSLLGDGFAGGGGRGGGHGYLGFSSEHDEDKGEDNDNYNDGKPGSSTTTTDAYYQKMIQANPGNSLVLGNYAKFLKEVRGDLVKAKEYCERALVANPRDATVLALYADLIWQSNRDAQRAELYFDQAVQAAPQDCYIMASYARFLWDAEDDDVEGKEDEQQGNWPEGVKQDNQTVPPFHPGAAAHPIAAAL